MPQCIVTLNKLSVEILRHKRMHGVMGCLGAVADLLLIT